MNDLDFIIKLLQLPVWALVVGLLIWGIKKMLEKVDVKDLEIKQAWSALVEKQGSYLDKHVECLMSVKINLMEQTGAIRALSDQIRGHEGRVETALTELAREVRK